MGEEGPSLVVGGAGGGVGASLEGLKVRVAATGARLNGTGAMYGGGFGSGRDMANEKRDERGEDQTRLLRGLESVLMRLKAYSSESGWGSSIFHFTIMLDRRLVLAVLLSFYSRRSQASRSLGASSLLFSKALGLGLSERPRIIRTGDSPCEASRLSKRSTAACAANAEIERDKR